MPATAGRVRMPANNRVHSSAALQTHGIWQSAIGYDPYAPTNNSEKDAKPSADRSSVADGGEGGENAYASFQGLLALARITGTNADDTRGACKKCGRVGHLTFQCRNFLSLKAGREKDEAAADEAVALFNELKKSGGRKEEESEEEEEDESSDSDSDLDPEIEKIIAARYGKKGKKRSGRRSRRSEDEEEEKRRKRKERRRYLSSDDEDERDSRRRKSRKEGKRRRNHRRRDDSDYEDDGRYHRKRSNRRKDESSSDSHRHHKRRRERRKAETSSSDTSDSLSDGEKKRSEKRRRRNGKE